MKSSVVRYWPAALAAAAILAGCMSMYDSSVGSGSAGGGGGGTGSNTFVEPDDFDAPGNFADGSHDNDTSQPPVLPGDATTEEGEETASHFRAIQLDPVLEDTAGPKFVRALDMDKDGDIDLVTGWNQSQPVQLHLQYRDGDAVRFRAVNLGGTDPIAVLGGLDVADLNGDGWLDIALAIKHTGHASFCGDALTTWCGLGPVADPTAQEADVGEVMILFNPGSADAMRDGERWAAVGITESYLDGRRDKNYVERQREPEWNSYTALVTGDLNCDGRPDIAVNFNPAACEDECEKYPLNRTVLYANPGGGTPAAWAAAWADVSGVWAYAATGPIIKDLAVSDVDDDGDVDLIVTHPNQASGNVSWLINQCTGGANWNECPIGHVDTEADVVEVGDVDGDGYDDVLVRSTLGAVVQWFKRPTDDGTEPIFPPTAPPTPDRDPPSNQAFCSYPWPVFTVKEFDGRAPEGITLGDVTGDGQAEAIIAAGGAVFWYQYDPAVPGGLYDMWIEAFVVDDTKEQGETANPNDPDYRDQATYINRVLVADVDGDGFNDIIGTLDRQTRSGLADDALLWFRNTLGDSRE